MNHRYYSGTVARTVATKGAMLRLGAKAPPNRSSTGTVWPNRSANSSNRSSGTVAGPQPIGPIILRILARCAAAQPNA